MAKIKFRSTVATVNNRKDDRCLIDSGGTHHFFHTKESFLDYQTISNQTVQSASECSKVIGEGTVRLPFDDDVIIEAYNAPTFSATSYQLEC